MPQKPVKSTTQAPSSREDSETKLNESRSVGKSFQPLIPSKNYNLSTVYRNTITVYMAVLEKAYDTMAKTGEYPPKDVLAAIQAVLNPFLKEKVEGKSKKAVDPEAAADVDIDLLTKKLKSLDAH
mgnify:CR=1 FL=1